MDEELVIAHPDEIDRLMGTWPANSSNAPPRDDAFAKSETERLARWWLSLPQDGLVRTIRSHRASGKAGEGWHFWFELTHPAYPKPARCFRVLVQHWKPPRVYQLQFPMEVRELPVTTDNRNELLALIADSEVGAKASGLRDDKEDKNVKSINLYRPFNAADFKRFTDLVFRFVDGLRVVLDSPTAPQDGLQNG